MLKIYLFFVLTLICIDGKPLKNNAKKVNFSKLPPTAPPIKTDADALAFLTKYGYNEPGGCDDGKVNDKGPLRQSSFQTMIESFQTLFNLPVSGKLDNATVTLMKKPRCGLEDFAMACFASRPWPNTTLKWRLHNQIPTIGRDKIRSQIQEAFDDWAQYAALKFQEANGNEKAEFNVSFQTLDHGDHFPFDGPGGNLAHALFPKNGEIHLDAAEDWTYKYDGSGINLRFVTAHAIGHALGLSHSHNDKSLMYPFYQLLQPSNILSTEDQESIRVFYGPSKINHQATSSPTKTTVTHKKGKKTKKQKTTRTPGTSHDRCTHHLDVIFRGGSDKLLYILDDDLVWRYHSDSNQWNKQGLPIADVFPGSEPNMTAGIFSPKTKKAYLFKDYRIWRYTTGNKLDTGFPKRISGTSIPDNPIAALYEKNNIWLLKNGLLFKFDENKLQYESNPTSKHIDKQFSGVPKNVRSGFTFNEKHYFFTEPDQKVYIFDTKTQRLEPGYPKPMVTGWFACKGQ